jgi:nitroreductase
MVPTAPVAVLVCGVPDAGRWPQFWPQDCAAATQNLLLAAEELGLGAVWLGIHPLEERERGMRELLDIPDSVVPFALVPLGHPAGRKPPADRYDPERVHRERWAGG